MGPPRVGVGRAAWYTALALGVHAALALGCERAVRLLMEPAGPFDPAAVPAPPDYRAPAAWSALPGREDAADAEAPGLPAAAPGVLHADVFYVHPTSYVGSAWNGPVDDPTLNADTDRVATRIQASAFTACCAVYAPRYRQANGTAFTDPSEDGRRALDLAYGDVRAAFQSFRQRRDGARPFVLAAHSQGSALAYRLLREEIAPTPLRERLVAAYLIGAPLTEEGVARDLAGLRPCASPEETACVVGWNARAPGYVPGAFEFRGEAGTPLCVNPLSWQRDAAPVPAAENRGAVFLDADPVLVAPAFASARCRGPWLEVELAGAPPRDFMSRLLDRALGLGNYHPIEYQLFYADLRANAAARVQVWRARHEGAG